MINLKAVLAAGVVSSMVVGGLGFKYTVTNTEYYYKSGTAFQRLEPGHLTESDLKERSISFPVFVNSNNWTSSAQNFTRTADYSKYIGSISFEEEFTADGGSDGLLTLQEALNAIYAYYSSTSPTTMQAVVTAGNATVYISAATIAH
jgi:hypothetical protein